MPTDSQPTPPTIERKLRDALRFIVDLSHEELEYAQVGTGGEVALRHIHRRATEALKDWSIAHGG